MNNLKRPNYPKTYCEMAVLAPPLLISISNFLVRLSGLISRSQCLVFQLYNVAPQIQAHGKGQQRMCRRCTIRTGCLVRICRCEAGCSYWYERRLQLDLRLGLFGIIILVALIF